VLLTTTVVMVFMVALIRTPGFPAEGPISTRLGTGKGGAAVRGPGAGTGRALQQPSSQPRLSEGLLAYQQTCYLAVMASKSVWDPVGEAESEGSAFLSERQLARILGLSVATLRRWRQVDQGPPYCRLGRMVRYPMGETEQWIEAQLHTPES
jgi:predicted DNA-binding transcriptional regulator AlpA